MLIPLSLQTFTTITLFFVLCWANVEKVVFLGPDRTNIPNVSPSLSDLHLEHLTPDKTNLRIPLPRSFANQSLPKGLQSWYILDDLEPGRRYDVRVCWLATEPTEFWLEAYELQQVFNSPDLIAGLAGFADAEERPSPLSLSESRAFTGERSLLLLQIHAAADYFTTNKALMEAPPPVLVDISE